MKYLVTLFILVFSTTNAISQDSRLTTEEIGIKIVSGRILTHPYDRIVNNPSLQFLDGIFYRVSKNRLAIRLALDLTWDERVSLRESVIFMGRTPRFSRSKDIKISLGGQYNLLNEKKWIYVFTELYYRNIYSSGELIDE